MIGRTLGHYRILDRLGTGGMGVVWLAEDLGLGRKVALKMLRDEVAMSPEKRARFEREARAVAALKHPNVVTLHSIEQADAVRFITMELVLGQSLDRMGTSGGLPLARLLELGTEHHHHQRQRHGSTDQSAIEGCHTHFIRPPQSAANAAGP